MEELMDFDEWIKIANANKIQYWAKYDPDNGKVLGIYPGSSADTIKNKIEIDQETAESINDGTTSIFNCHVDLESGNLEIIEIKSLTSIDDVLHRVVDSKWSDTTDADIYITHNNSTISIILNEKYRKGKRIFWNGETEMNFFITDYNDPNVLHNMFTVKLSKLIEENLIVDYDVSLVDANLAGWGDRSYDNCIEGYPEIKLINKTTDEAAELFNDISYLHVDADHSEQQVYKDLCIYGSRMKQKNWIITCHDTHTPIGADYGIGVYNSIKRWTQENNHDLVNFPIGYGTAIIMPRIEGSSNEY